MKAIIMLLIIIGSMVVLCIVIDLIAFIIDICKEKKAKKQSDNNCPYEIETPHNEKTEEKDNQ